MNPGQGTLADQVRQKMNDGSLKLPALPDTVARVQQLVSGEDYSVADIAKVLQKDAALAGVVIRLANSVHFNPSGKEIRNLGQSIQRIGMQALPKLLMSVSSRMFCKVKAASLREIVRKNQDRSLTVAVAAERIAHVSGGADPGDTFMAALLHDQGKDVLIMTIQDELMAASPEELEDILDLFHREMGSRLLHKWNLPTEFVLVAQHHEMESPDRPRSSILDCVDAANLMVRCIDSGSEDCMAKTANHPAVKRLRLSDIDLVDIEISIEDQVAELRQAFAA